MNHKPNSLTGLAALLFAMTICGAVVRLSPAKAADEVKAAEKSAETPPADPAAAAGGQKTAETAAPASGSGTPPGGSSSPPGPPGNDLLNQVREQLQGVTSLTCDIHQTAMLSGMKFQAAGRYVQSTGNRFRLDFQIFPVVSAKSDDAAAGKLDAEPTADPKLESKASITQVSDGNVLFTFWKNGPDTRVTRRNINDILKASSEATAYDRNRAFQDLGLGGLAALIARVQSTMDLSPVRSETHGGTDFRVVTGRWNKTVRQQLFQLPDDTEVIPQDFIPEYVRLYIDAKSSLPRRIQYLKRLPDPAANPVQVRPLITIDLRQIVLNASVDDSVFVFSVPEGVTEEDLTEQTIQGIRQTLQPPAAPAGAGAAAGTGASGATGNAAAVVPGSPVSSGQPPVVPKTKP